MLSSKKRILVTGAAGMIGRYLVKKLIENEHEVTATDIYKPSEYYHNVEYKTANLIFYDQCLELCSGKDIVIHLAGIKGSPKMCIEQPARFMVPMLQFNTNILEAAKKNKVEWIHYTSSVGVYSPADIFYEDDVWKTFPSDNDWFAGWAKRIGELQAQAYELQDKISNISIVRPANVYGNYDNFDLSSCMVIPALIRKAYENDTLEVWGDGSPIRDFIHADDVASGIIDVISKEYTKPLNLGSGKGYSIKEIVNTVTKYANRKTKVKWLSDKPAGDRKRIFDTTRAKDLGIIPKISIEEGIKNTTEWFLENYNVIDERHNSFSLK